MPEIIMECSQFDSSPTDPYWLVLEALSLIPLRHYVMGAAVAFIVFLYNFVDFHFIEDVFSGFRGCPVVLTYNSCSEIYEGIVAKCRLLHGRYLATPWLSSPHVQTVFLNFFGRPPVFKYRRQLFCTSDGGTIALDWLMSSDVSDSARHIDDGVSRDDTTPLVVVIPGLTSDSYSPTDPSLVNSFLVETPQPDGRVLDFYAKGSQSLYVLQDSSQLHSKELKLPSQVAGHLIIRPNTCILSYLKHLVFGTAKRGWNVVVSNHRGLGGVSITSDCFYNAGWTEDVRTVINYLHEEHPRAPLFVVGTSIGANILIKYLGEDGENIPVAGAVAICCPWDLLIGDRFINRRLVQKFYDRALAIGLQGYAKLHQPHFSRLANWEGIEKSLSIRDFDNHCTRIVGKYETVDTYYRRCSSAIYVESVSIPLLCISALDDPLCTKEAIPWDECRENKNVVLACTKHGGHLAFFEGITASGLWWVRAANEFLTVLHSSKLMHVQKKIPKPHTPLDSSIDQGPYVNVTEDGMVAALNNEQTTDNESRFTHVNHDKTETLALEENCNEQKELVTDNSPGNAQVAVMQDAMLLDAKTPIRRYLGQLSRQNRWSIGLLVYIAITTSWPLLGSVLRFVFGKKPRNALRSDLFRK